MYRYSYRAEGPWLGEYDHPQRALEGGRANLGNVSRVFVGKMEPAYWSDMMISSSALLSYMQEYAADFGDDFVTPFENLPATAERRMWQYIKDAIGEWESELPEELQFTGEIVKQRKGYTASAMVRPADFK